MNKSKKEALVENQNSNDNEPANAAPISPVYDNVYIRKNLRVVLLIIGAIFIIFCLKGYILPAICN